MGARASKPTGWEFPPCAVVRVGEVDQYRIAAGVVAAVHHDSADIEGRRCVLVPLDDPETGEEIPAPKEKGKTANAIVGTCHYLQVFGGGSYAFDASGVRLVRRVPPKTTVEEALETLRDYVSAIMGRSASSAHDALAVLEKHLEGADDPKNPNSTGVTKAHARECLKRLNGDPPYDDPGNPCRGDGYYANSLEGRFGMPIGELEAWSGYAGADE